MVLTLHWNVAWGWGPSVTLSLSPLCKSTFFWSALIRPNYNATNRPVRGLWAEVGVSVAGKGSEEGSQTWASPSLSQTDKSDAAHRQLWMLQPRLIWSLLRLLGCCAKASHTHPLCGWPGCLRRSRPREVQWALRPGHWQNLSEGLVVWLFIVTKVFHNGQVPGNLCKVSERRTSEYAKPIWIVHQKTLSPFTLISFQTFFLLWNIKRYFEEHFSFCSNNESWDPKHYSMILI